MCLQIDETKRKKLEEIYHIVKINFKKNDHDPTHIL